MADVNISKYRASVVREGSTPASPGFVVSEGQNPVDPSGSGQNHLPVTIATAATGLSITESQVLGGAGTVGQYIRGDGSLADFPATTGGGSSVSYYLNGSVSQGTIGGVAYKELNRTPVFGTGTDISINADGYIASFITDALDPNKLLIPGGNWNFETYFSASSSGGSPSFYVELYKYDGTTFTLLATSSSAPELIAFGTNLNPYFSTLAVPETVLALTDRLAVRFYVTHSGRTITLHTEDNHLCQVITTFTTGLTALNGLTNQVQYLTVGTSGTDFAISSASDTHTFNLPTASATNRGALSSADWSTFNGKENAITAGTTAQYFRGDKTFQTLNTSVVPEGTNLYYTEARVNANTNVAANTAARHNAVTLGTANGLSLSTQVLSLGLASAGVTGALSGTDWSTFNNKQNALTNPVTGTGTSGQIAYFNGTSAITGESALTWDATNDRLNIGGGTANSNLTVSGSDNSIIFSVLAGVNSRLHVGTVSSGTITYIRSQNNYALNLGVNNTDYLSISTAGNSSFSGNIILTNGVNRFVRIGSASNYNYDLQTTGDDFQIIEAGASIATPRLTIKYPSGNVLIGTTTDNGAKFQIIKDNDISLSLRSGASGSFTYAAIGRTSDELAIGIAGASDQFFSGSVAGDAAIKTLGTNNKIFLGYGSTAAMTINHIGNISIGDTNPTSSAGWTPKLVLNAISAALIVKGVNGQQNTFGSSDGLYIDSLGNSTGSNNRIIFRTTNSNSNFSATERVRITSDGFLKASNTGTYALSSGSFHELINSATGNNIVYLYNTAANPYGPYVRFSGAAPNNSTNYYLYFDDTSTVRFRVNSNGGISNYQANDVNLSDERTKKEIKPLESYWDKFKAIEIVKFKYKDQTHDDFNIGVIAQQVEKVAPEFVDVDGWNNKTEGNEIINQEEPIKSIYTADLHHATIKVLQEAMAKIESMQKEIDTLKN